MSVQKIDRGVVSWYLCQMVENLAKQEQLKTPEYLAWDDEDEEEHKASGEEWGGRVYDGVDALFEDRGGEFRLGALEVELERMQHEFLKYLCFGLIREAAQKSTASIFARYSISYKGYRFIIHGANRIWIEREISEGGEGLDVPVGHGEDRR